MKQYCLTFRGTPMEIDLEVKKLITGNFVIEHIVTLFPSTGWDGEMEPTVLIIYRKKNALGE